ncbi:flippase [Methylophaga sp.]|uniref:flippase n=1 Tax=Methylophaga sp. TaxID=2024840 RepID=UPI00271B54A7|nr:flippase [Methylophaga sp.]MDO8828425.1 flippase [Methylophaga sp.]
MLLSKLHNAYSDARLYINNTFWILADKLLMMGITFLVMVFVARYLGPEQYGLLAYAITLASILSVAGHMGLSGLVIREVVKKPESEAITLGTAFVLKLAGVIVGYIALLVYALLYEGTSGTAFYLILIAGSMILFKPFDVIEFRFHAYVQAKYVSLARLISLCISSAVNVAFVIAGASLVFFAFANVLQAILGAFFLVVIFYYQSRQSIGQWRFNGQRARELFSQGWIVYLGTFFAIIYMKIDQIMLRWLSSMDELGQYAVAAQLSEAWYFLPAAIVTTVFPKLIKLRQQNEQVFNQRLQQLFDLLFILAFIVAIIMTFFAEWFVVLFFGVEFAAAASILIVHIWAALFVFMRAAFSKWILIENVLIFSLITQGLGAVVNVFLNLLLIPEYGGMGAAYATVISYITASYFSLLIYAKTRKIFWMMTLAIVSPVRYLRTIRGLAR